MEQKYRHTTLFKRIISRLHRQPRGQSFVELMFVVTFLALLLSGMVELGFMLNEYLHVLDGSREAARYSSSYTPFIGNGLTITGYYYPPYYYIAAGNAAQTMDPVILDPLLAEQGKPLNTDDIVVSTFSLDGGTLTRFPPNDPNGWSLCAHYKANADDSAVVYPANPVTSCTGQPYGGFASYFSCLIPSASVPTQLPSATWGAGCHVRTSQITNAVMATTLGSVPLVSPSLPKTGAVLVEIFYNYPQLLKLPVLTSVVSDPIPLYVYSIMPLSSAEPTQVP
jgi:hypothetical protein